MRRRTSAAALVATLAVLTCVAVSGCRAGSDEAPYPEVTAQIGPPSMPAEEEPPLPPQEQPPVTRLPVPTGNPPDEAPPPLPPQEQPPEMSAPAPPEAPPHGMVVVPTVPLGADEEPAETEFLTSGPVHEAFAEPVDLQPEPGLLVPEEPPADIDEVPPAERPEGADIAWVAGYWAWDDDRAGYIWVSGCWRAAPPGMRWEPGYWAAVPGGWQWVSGFWQQVSVQTVVYLPQAPPFDDLEPPGPAPAEDTVWVPPCHYWLRGRYVLRRGYWLTLRDGWVWVPSHYVWTPHGYVFIPGHWDLALYRRGVLFAPAYFPRFVYARRAFSYSPIIVVDLALLTGDLFVYPRYCHYFFGDYYDDIYLRVGIYPWCDSIRVRRWYDPIYVYDRWRHRRSDPRWDQHQRDEYDRRRADTHHRPPRTYREMEKGLAEMPDSERHGHRLARPLASVVSGNEGPRRFVRISDDETRRRIAREATDARSSPRGTRGAGGRRGGPAGRASWPEREGAGECAAGTGAGGPVTDARRPDGPDP